MLLVGNTICDDGGSDGDKAMSIVIISLLKFINFVPRSAAQPGSSKTHYLNVIGIDLFGVV